MSKQHVEVRGIWEIISTIYLNTKDYDGDEMNVQLLVDEYLHNEFKSMAPHASVAHMESPGSVSGRLSLTKPVVATISNYIYQEQKRLNYKGVKWIT